MLHIERDESRAPLVPPLFSYPELLFHWQAATSALYCGGRGLRALLVLIRHHHYLLPLVVTSPGPRERLVQI